MSDTSFGFIKIHRKLLDNPVVCKDPEHLAVWIYLLLNATHKNQRVLFQGKDTILYPGQLLTGRKSISRKLKIDEQKVQRILKTFENAHQIEQQTSNKNRLITILNWKTYQQSEHQNEQQVNNNRTSSEQQVNTNKNVKNDKNEKNNTYCAFFDSVWELYPNKKGKAKVSKKAIEELQELGFEKIKKCIDAYVLQKPDWQQWQNGSTFFNGGYLDYLGADAENQKEGVGNLPSDTEWQ